MKGKITLALTLCLLLSGCGQKGPPESTTADNVNDDEMILSTTPVAQVEGEPVSPDGRFEVQGEGASGEYVSGVQPPELLQIIDRKTKDVLWEDRGWLWQSALWSPSSGYVALAYGARTWAAVKILETGTWTSWEFTLPDGEAIPEYTFLPDAWGVWGADNQLELTIGDGDGEAPLTYRCVVEMENGKLTGHSREITKEILPGDYDFNHDGKPETLELTTVWFPGLTDAAIDTYILSVLDESGNILWQDTAGTSHAGENSLYACQVDGKDYFLRYLPMQQGICTYNYELFSLNEENEEICLRENTVEFSADGSTYGLAGFDIPEIENFLREVHSYLDTGILLVSTTPEDDLFFLNRDNGVSLTENLQRYKEGLEAFCQETKGAYSQHT